MQRSAAKSVASSPSAPNGPPSKKVRLSNGTSAHGTPDHQILQTALAEEEKKRQEALDKAAQHTGETKWVLSLQNSGDNQRRDAMKVRQAGFAELDAEEESEEEEEEARPARMQFGGGLKKNTDVGSCTILLMICINMLQNSTPFEDAEDSEDESHSTSEDPDSDDPAAALIRETRREMAAEKRQSRANAANNTPKRTPKPFDEDMDMAGLHSLSGGGAGSRPSGRAMSNIECYGCGQIGHTRVQCPNKSRPRGSSSRGRDRGRP